MSQQPQTLPPDARPASLADLVQSDIEPSGGLGREAWIKFAVIAALLVGMNSWQGQILYNIWTRPDGNWMHCFVIPLFSLYLLYSRRTELLSASRQTCWWGLPVVILGVLMQAAAVYLHNHWLYQLNMVVVVFGLVLLLAGKLRPNGARLCVMAWISLGLALACWELAGRAPIWISGNMLTILKGLSLLLAAQFLVLYVAAGDGIIRVTWVPILYLWFAMPISDGIYNSIAYPLQELAARTSTAILSTFGVEITRAGSSMDVVGVSGKVHHMQVVEACSGVRSLMAFLALGVAMAYLEDRPVWQRVVYVLSAIPIAILCNILRVTITAEVFHLDQEDLGKGFMHEFTGLLMLVPAFIMLWLVGKVLQSIYVEEDDDEPAGTEGGSSLAAAASTQEVAK